MRAALTALACLLACAFGGCGPEREPVPVVVIQVLEQPGVYLLDGKRMFTADLQAELQAIADKHRRPTTGTSRCTVQIYYPSNVRYGRVQDLLGWCGRVGLDKVTAQVRDAETPVPEPTIPRAHER